MAKKKQDKVGNVGLFINPTEKLKVSPEIEVVSEVIEMSKKGIIKERLKAIEVELNNKPNSRRRGGLLAQQQGLQQELKTL